MTKDEVYEMFKKLEAACKRGDRFCVDILYTQLTKHYTDKELIKLYKGMNK